MLISKITIPVDGPVQMHFTVNLLEDDFGRLAEAFLRAKKIAGDQTRVVSRPEEKV